jgi:hypothetical protein
MMRAGMKGVISSELGARWTKIEFVVALGSIALSAYDIGIDAWEKSPDMASDTCMELAWH